MSTDTIATNRRLGHFRERPRLWLFGYGSIMHKVDFPWLERRPAHVSGWARRFWQGSHDHRGTAQAPGRVVTLVPQPGHRCAGIAYRIVPDVLDHLDVREKNGYLRVALELEFADGERIDGMSYIAPPGNGAWLGPADDLDIARQIAAANGPSGRNRDYLLALADALRELGEDDPHVFALERLVRMVDRRAG